MKLKISGKFIKALVIDLILIALVLYIHDLWMGTAIFVAHYVHIAILYAVLHTVAETAGVG